MAVNLARLEQAAGRFEKYTEKMRKADTPAVREEQAVVARRHREQFLPAAEKFQQLRSAAVASRIRDAATATPPPSDLVVAGVIPEILERDNDLRPVRYLQIALLAARSVGRVRVVDAAGEDEGDGTGFLVAPGLLLTNWHVLKTRELAEACSVVFDDEDGLDGDPKESKVYRFLPERLYVSDKELDYAIVEVSPRTGSGTPLSQFGYLRLFEQTGKLDPTQRQAANIVQHPGGGPKKVAIRDNYFAQVLPDSVDPAKEVNSLFYGTDTLKGSSGAPVCSDQWYVVALHRGGVPATKIVDGRRVAVRFDGTPARASDPVDLIRYVTNEGTRVSRIYASLRAKRAQDPHAAAALERLSVVARDPRLGPLDLRTAPIVLPATPAAEEGAVEEIIRRSVAKFKDAKGYQTAFLGAGFSVPLPSLTSEVDRELAPLRDSEKTELKYDHYSLRINRERRTAFFVAANVNGAQLWKTAQDGQRPDRPQWSFDPRMREEFQPDDVIFSSAMQRGHLYKREDAMWGADRDAKRHADEHSFTITNATPMIANFNNVEWGDLEDIVSRECGLGNKVSYFAGPIFRPSDPFFNELTSFAPPDQRHTGMRVPQSFWKIVFWIENGALKAAGFILRQTDEIEAHGPIAEEINFGTYRKKRITEIEQRTGLRFPKLVAADTFGQQ
jgi:endonuclease G